MIDDDDAFHAKLRALIQNEPDADLGTEAVRALTEATHARRAKLQQTVASLQDSLDYLRLSVKYLVFDLEATRRENEYLRKLLSGRGDGNAGI